MHRVRWKEGRGRRETLFRFSTPNTPLLTLRCVLQRRLWPTQIKRYQVPKLWPCLYFSTQAMTVIHYNKRNLKKKQIFTSFYKKHTIMNGPHDSECIKSLHVLIWLAASYHLPQYYAKTAQFEFKEKHVLQGWASSKKKLIEGSPVPWACQIQRIPACTPVNICILFF